MICIFWFIVSITFFLNLIRILVNIINSLILFTNFIIVNPAIKNNIFLNIIFILELIGSKLLEYYKYIELTFHISLYEFQIYCFWLKFSKIYNLKWILHLAAVYDLLPKNNSINRNQISSATAFMLKKFPLIVTPPMKYSLRNPVY